jgi:hypothetical protein
VLSGERAGGGGGVSERGNGGCGASGAGVDVCGGGVVGVRGHPDKTLVKDG